MKRIFIVFIALFSCSLVFSQNITGSWNGVLDYGTGALRIVFHIEEKDGVYTTTMDSPDQGVDGIKTTNTIVKKKNLTVNIAKLFAKFEGKVKKNSIEGTFTQGGASLPLVLTRGTIEINRPQTPKPPYPYNSEDVYFENKQADITLAGTLTFPKEGNNFPVVVLITGSGGQNRNEELANHQPFLVLSDYLTRQGIAVLRYDDRGVGESKGVYHTATIQDFATDALAAVAYLKTRPEINPKQIGLIGHSEGGSISFIASADNKDIAFIVSMAGVAIKGDSLMKLQREASLPKMGVSKKDIEKNEESLRQLEAVVKKHSVDSVFNYPEKYIDEIIPADMKNNTAARNSYKNALMNVASPEMYSFNSYSPTEDFKKIQCPVFAINGEKDLQVLPDVNLQNFEKWLPGKVTTKKYPDLNHLFQHAQTGLSDEYSKIEETISEEVLEDIAKWIKSVIK
jgi:pimeloyl-ACP methyl ester carboxylesterase